MYGCYRREEAADATVMLDAAAAVLADYTPDVIRYVTDPRTGLQSRLKWPPNIAEIKEACEKRTAELHVIEQRERLYETGFRRDAIAAPKEPRPSYEDLKAKHGETFGLGETKDVLRREPPSPHYRTDRALTPEELQHMFAARKAEATKRGEAK